MRPPDGLSIGVATILRSDIHVGEHSDPARLLPTVQYRRGRWTASMAGVVWRAASIPKGSVALELRARPSALDDSNAPELAGIDRELTADIGVSVRRRTGIVLWQASAVQEVTGEHQGYELDLRAGVPVPLPFLRMQISAGVRYESEHLADYLYGVREEESLADRSTYEAGSATVPFLALRAIKPLHERWVVLGSAQAHFLPTAATFSPIVDRNVQFSLLFGVSYRF